MDRSRAKSKSHSRKRTTGAKRATVPTRKRASKASTTMSLGDLQMVARSLGIAFGGLSKTKLIRKINLYK